MKIKDRLTAMRNSR